MGMRKGGRPSLFPGSGDGSTLSLDFTTGVLDSRLTFSRASTATFVNSSGYVDHAGANVLLQGSNLGNATSWFGNGLTSRNPSTDPNGSNQAVELNEDATNTVHVVIQVSSQNLNGLVYTSTVYMKAGTNRTIGFMRDNNVSSDAAVFYTLTGSGTATIANGAYGIAASINAVGGGWYRCVFTIKGASTANVTIGTAKGTAYGDWSFAGTVGNSIHVWGAQLNPGSTAQTYYPTTTAAYHAPRFDYSPTTIGEPRGLLIEGQVPTLNAWSEDFTQSYWNKVNTTIASTSVTCPDNIARTTVRVTDNSTNAAHTIRRGIATTAGSTYTISWFVKKGSTDTFGVQMYWDATYNATLLVSSIDNNTQTVTSATNVNATVNRISYPSSGWFRYVMTFTHPSATGAATPDFNFAPINNLNTYVGSSNYADFFGIQLEAGSGASSYIPTGASQVTRNVDNCYMNDISALSYSTTNGTLFYESLTTKWNISSYPARIGFTKETGDYRSFGALTDIGQMLPNVGGPAGTPTVLVGLPFSLNTNTKCAWSFDAALSTAEVKATINGGAIVSSTSSALTVSETPSYFGFGQKGYDLYLPSGTVKQVKYWPTTLSTAQLQTLTAP